MPRLVGLTNSIEVNCCCTNNSAGDDSFQRKTGYVQQQDLHLATATVRETLEFSALLRQPARYSKAEKLAYVDEVIKMLDMQSYRDAVVGIPGEGLNVEQRKRLTIGVEIAARPALLLFLDEPTSGLDSQTSWSIVNLLTKLSESGQAVLCTIHQPSAILFQRFDRLLLLAKGGRTVYFGDIGRNSKTLIDYFVSQGGSPPSADSNPAEWMLETIGAAPGVKSDIDWPSAWRSSDEYKGVQAELQRLEQNPQNGEKAVDKSDFNEFAAPFLDQLLYATKRTFQQYWRSPAYLNSKALLTIGSVSSSVFLLTPNNQKANTERSLSSSVSLFSWPTTLSRASRTRCSAFWSSSLS
jgi:ATP-binding cassette subfamily G (WHITE) protein 2 (PDR)